MGKGSRNRLDRKYEAPAKKAKKKAARKPLPKFVKSIIAWGLVVLIVAGATVGILSANGVFKRNTIIVKSKTGNYDIDQQMATYLAFVNSYSSGYYNWLYSEYYSADGQAKLSDSYSSYQQYCLDYAYYMVSQKANTAMNGQLDYLKDLVAVCDASVAMGISLTADEIKEAEDGVIADLEQINTTDYSTKGFVHACMGSSVSLKDVKRAGVITALYQKVTNAKNAEFEGTGLDTIEKYRDENPASYYSSEYYEYKTENETLKDALANAASSLEFRRIIAKDVFEKNYAEQAYLYLSEAAQLKADLIANAEKEDKADFNNDFTTGLTVALNTKDDTAAIDLLPTDVKNWVNGSHTAYTATVIRVPVENNPADYYVLAVGALDEEGGTVVRYVIYPESEITSYDGDAEFKNHLQDAFLVACELGGEDITDSKDYLNKDTVKDVVAKLKELAKKELPASATKVSYTATPTTDAEKWLYEGMNGLTSPITAGTVKVNSTEAPYTVWCLDKVMSLDESRIVKGGYLKYDTLDAANAALATLSGKKGDDLYSAFEALSDEANVGKTLTESTVSGVNADLGKWLFATDRADGDATVISGDSEYYLAFYNSAVPSWENSARSNYQSEQVSAWMEELAKDYTVNEKAVARIKDKQTETAETTAA